jgi:hypothetical protein
MEAAAQMAANVFLSDLAEAVVPGAIGPTRRAEYTDKEVDHLLVKSREVTGVSPE